MKTAAVIRVLWPAFLTACALEFFVFGLVDPLEALPQWAWSRKQVYAAAFLVFWAISSLGCAMVVWLAESPPTEG